VRKLLFFTLIALILWSQIDSLEKKGERRFRELNEPAKEVVVGVSWPFKANQDGMADGLQLALDEINSGHLAGGHTIRLVMRDDDFDLEKAKKIAMEFADTPQMSAVIGYYDDDIATKATAIFEPSRLLCVIAGANKTAITAHGFEYVVRTTLSSAKIARRLARFSENSGYRKYAVIWEEEAFGNDLAHQYRVELDDFNLQAIPALSIEVVYQWSYSRTRADFRLPVNELKGTNADVIFLAGLEPTAGNFLRSAREVGLTTPIVGAFSDTPGMRAQAGSALEGTMFYVEYNLDSTSPENQAFVLKFRARYGKNPDTWAAQGYDALYILAKAIKLTGSRNPLDLSYAIRYMDAWEGANGRYKFTDQGELEDKPIFMKKYERGVPVAVDMPPGPAP